MIIVIYVNVSVPYVVQPRHNHTNSLQQLGYVAESYMAKTKKKTHIHMLETEI